MTQMNKTLSKPFALLALFVLGAWSAAPAAAQTAVRFLYLAPSATLDAAFGAANTFTSQTDGPTFPGGYKGVVITAANVATFNAQTVPALHHIFNQLQAGTTLRNRVDQVFTISGNRADVDYYLVDDRTGLASGSGGFAQNTIGATVFVWPAANNMPKSGAVDRHQGFAMFGEVFAAREMANAAGGGPLGLEATVLHETFHTQWIGDASRWGASPSGFLAYGGDGQHFVFEILGDQELPLNEGSGSFFGTVHNPADRTNLVNFLRDATERYVVEPISIPAGWQTLYQAPRKPGTIPLAPPASPVSVFGYKWVDVPSFYLLFVESTSTAFYSFFEQHAHNDRNRAFRSSMSAMASMWDNRHKRFLMYAVNRLALDMEAFAATPAGQAAKTAGTITSSMFPFALLDVLTHFGFTDDEFRREYRRHYPDRDPAALVEYFNRRAAVRSAVAANLAANPIQIEEAVRTIHTMFQQANTILLPPPPAPAPTN